MIERCKFFHYFKLHNKNIFLIKLLLIKKLHFLIKMFIDYLMLYCKKGITYFVGGNMQGSKNSVDCIADNFLGPSNTCTGKIARILFIVAAFRLLALSLVLLLLPAYISLILDYEQNVVQRHCHHL